MRAAVLFLFMASGVMMAQQVGTISAAGPFTLKGAKVDPKGVPAWPVAAGDEMATAEAGLTITFGDGSKITLQPHSKARVEMEAGVPVFRLLECGAYYEMKTVSAVKLYAGNQAVKATDATGKYSLGCAIKPAAAVGGAGGFWTAKTTALVIAAAGATAGIATGVAVASGDGKPVSPVR